MSDPAGRLAAGALAACLVLTGCTTGGRKASAVRHIKPLILNGIRVDVANERDSAIRVVRWDGDAPINVAPGSSLDLPIVGGPKQPWHLVVTDAATGSQIAASDVVSGMAGEMIVTAGGATYDVMESDEPAKTEEPE